MDRRLCVVIGLVTSIAVAGCSDPADETSPATTPTTPPGSGEVFSDTPATTGDTTVETRVAVPETGVPGIDSDDAFCRSWSQYAGTFNALAYAWGVQAPEAAAALEVAASAAITASVDGMSKNLPAEIESNRRSLTVDVPGPFLGRATKARALLVAAGADDATVDALGEAWIAAITEAGISSDDLSIAVPAGVGPILETAAAQFASDLPPMFEDPTLDTTQFDISPSLEYIANTCPDQGTLAGNDNVGADAS
jgi:hypothetical protein